MKLYQTLFCAAALAFAAPASQAETEPATTAQAQAQAQAQATLLTVNVKGMVCDFCARAVSKVFGKNDAVESVHVDLDTGEIHVGLKPGMDIADEDVETMVRKSGYSFVSLERETS